MGAEPVTSWSWVRLSHWGRQSKYGIICLPPGYLLHQRIHLCLFPQWGSVVRHILQNKLKNLTAWSLMGMNVPHYCTYGFVDLWFWIISLSNSRVCTTTDNNSFRVLWSLCQSSVYKLYCNYGPYYGASFKPFDLKNVGVAETQTVL